MTGRSIAAWCLVTAAAALLQGCAAHATTLVLALGTSSHYVHVKKSAAGDRVVICHTSTIYMCGDMRTEEWAAIAVPTGGERREYRFRRYRIKAAEGKELAAKGRSLCDMERRAVPEGKEAPGQEYFWGDGADTVIRVLDGGNPPRYVTMTINVPYDEEGVRRHPLAYPLIGVLIVPALLFDTVTWPFQES
jgi:hypothetical protein